MPQMNPISWLTLFIFFIVIFLLTNSLIFFSKKLKTNKTLNVKKLNNLNSWKW